MERRRVGLVMVGALIASVLATGAASPASATGCGAMETVSLKTFKIDAKPRKSTYRVGETIIFDAKVVRPNDTDPFNVGVPMDGVDKQPAEEVNIGAGIIINDVFLSGFATTNDAGKATIKIKIEKYARPGIADAAFYAWKTQADTPCLRVEENGFRPYPEILKVS